MEPLEGGPDPAGVKAELRRRVLARRDAMDAELRRRLSAVVFERIAALAELRAARVVLGYASFGSEPSTRAFLARVLAEGRGLALPRIDRARRRLELHRVGDLGRDLRPGVWGIAEPDPARCPPAPLDTIDLVLVPGVAFDARGGRIGYGAGYYDRLLAGWPATPPLVAAAFAAQIVEAVPVLPHDRRVDRVVTEAATYPMEGG